MARLVWLYPAGPELAKEYPLAGHVVILGRGEECAIRVQSDSLSRQHARIHDNGDAWVVEDLESSNGTFVNEVRVERSILRDADQVRVGGVIFRFHLAGGGSTGGPGGDRGSGASAELEVRRPGIKN